MTLGSFGRLTDAPADLVLVGARIVDPRAGTDRIGDIAIRDGIIADEAGPGAEQIDAHGLVVAPGLCDLHVHLREPGTRGETVASGSRAAARGGFTTICAMPNTDPAIDSAAAVTAALARGASACVPGPRHRGGHDRAGGRRGWLPWPRWRPQALSASPTTARP